MISQPLDHLADSTAEDAILLSAMVEPRTIDQAGDQLTAEDFSDPGKGKLWALLQVLRDARTSFSVPNLIAEMGKHGIRDDLRNPVKIAQAFRLTVPEVRHCGEYIRRVKELSDKRRLLAVIDQANEKILDRRSSSTDVSQFLDSQIQAMGHETGTPRRKVAAAAAEVLADLRRPNAERPIVMTGLARHDGIAGGWLGGEMIVLAARPGQGKTALAMQIATHVAGNDRPVLFASLEMEDRELVTRLLCGYAGIDGRRFRSGNYDGGHIDKMQYEAEGVDDLPLHIWSPPAATLRQIRAVAKQQAATDGLGFLVVDYLQLIRPANPRDTRYEQVSEISRSLKSLAKELKVPLLCLAQLNRQADGEIPKLSHLRDSGAIEQDADAVLFVHREEESSPLVRLVIAKHRHGETGQIQLNWNANRMRFEEPVPSFAEDAFGDDDF